MLLKAQYANSSYLFSWDLALSCGEWYSNENITGKSHVSNSLLDWFKIKREVYSVLWPSARVFWGLSNPNSMISIRKGKQVDMWHPSPFSGGSEGYLLMSCIQDSRIQRILLWYIRVVMTAARRPVLADLVWCLDMRMALLSDLQLVIVTVD